MSKKKEQEIIQDKIEGKAFDAQLLGERVIANECDEARALYDSSRYGEPLDKKFQYSYIESLYLLERGKLKIFSNKKELKYDDFLKKATKSEKNLWVRYCVFRDLRRRGYIVKTALKFGADFRVYDRGVKPGEDHAKWVAYPVHESSTFSWYDFSAKNRVAHSTRKKLLIGIVDEEGDVTYYSISWTRP